VTVDAVRQAVAAQHGLPEDAAGFLTGETITELEASADGLAALIASHRTGAEPDPEPASDLLTAARHAQQARKRELAAMFIGRPRHQQPRDEQGRYVSFDGGARAPVPAPRDPLADHDRAVTRLAAMAATFRGTTF
jgi:hypothetical protein